MLEMCSKLLLVWVLTWEKGEDTGRRQGVDQILVDVLVSLIIINVQSMEQKDVSFLEAIATSMVPSLGFS
jgi:hypothetical protein